MRQFKRESKTRVVKEPAIWGSLRKGVTDSMVNNRHADARKGVILSKSTSIYYNHSKQQEKISEVGGATTMLVEVVNRRTLDKILERRQPL